MDLSSDITDFCTNVMARPCRRDELVREIIKMATYNPAWPTASYQDWMLAIGEAVRQKKLIVTSETVWIPAVVEEAKPKQMEMF